MSDELKMTKARRARVLVELPVLGLAADKVFACADGAGEMGKMLAKMVDSFTAMARLLGDACSDIDVLEAEVERLRGPWLVHGMRGAVDVRVEAVFSGLFSLDAETGMVVAECLELRGVVSQGGTLKEAQANLREAVTAALRMAQEA